MPKPKNHILACPMCMEPLDVGDETRAVVAHCYKANRSCPGNQWGSASTRFGFGPEDKPSHIIQTDPPAEEQEEAAQAA